MAGALKLYHRVASMHISVQYPRFVGQLLDEHHRGVRDRPDRDFRPVDAEIQGLERRVMPSTSPDAAMGAGRALEQSSVTYPTPGGPRERLSVHIPPGPAPAGGRPVIIAIHGGGWRRLRQAGYRDRVRPPFR